MDMRLFNMSALKKENKSPQNDIQQRKARAIAHIRSQVAEKGKVYLKNTEVPFGGE